MRDAKILESSSSEQRRARRATPDRESPHPPGPAAAGTRRALLCALHALLASACTFDGSGIGPVGAFPTDAGPRPDHSADRGRIDLGRIDLGHTPDRGADAARDSEPDGPAPPWWDAAWTRRRKLTFDNSAGTEDLAQFPVLVVLDPTRIDYAATRDKGEDLRLLGADQVEVLPHEIERWQPGGVSHVWVRVPRIGQRSTTDHIWLYHGNPAAKALPAATAAGVWQDQFVGVWHLGDLKDSAGNLNAKDHGSAAADGKLAAGRAFDGQAYLELPRNSALDLQELTVELWVETSQVWDAPYWPASATLISRATPGWGSGDWTIVGGRDDADVGDMGRVIVGVGADYGTAWEPRVVSQGGLNDGGFHYVVWTRALTGPGQAENRLYVDGVEHAVVTDNGTTIVGDRPIQVGGDAHHDSGSFLQGVIDELRLSRIPRSAAWVAAQHASMTDSLVAFGPEEQP